MEKFGLKAITINSSNTDDWEKMEKILDRDEADILLIAPERFRNEYFNENIWPTLSQKTPLLVINEAHCASDWGHCFRPDYRTHFEDILKPLLEERCESLQLLATTATANERVISYLKETLDDTLEVVRGNLSRGNLSLQVIESATD